MTLKQSLSYWLEPWHSRKWYATLGNAGCVEICGCMIFWIILEALDTVHYNPYRLNPIMSRLSTDPASAHFTVYILIPTFFFIAFFLNSDRKHSFRAFLKTGLLVGVHETFWFTFYAAMYYNQIVWTGFKLLQQLNYYALLIAVIYLYGKYYAKWKMTYVTGLSIIIMMFFMIYWFHVWHFQISVINGNTPTKYWSDYTTNLLEDVSWYILWVGFVFSELEIWHYNRNHITPTPTNTTTGSIR
jgi:hypothetical protein